MIEFLAFTYNFTYCTFLAKIIYLFVPQGAEKMSLRVAAVILAFTNKITPVLIKQGTSQPLMLKAIAADKQRIVDVIFGFTHKNTSVLWKDHHNLECYKPQKNVKSLLQSSAHITSVFGNLYPLKWTLGSLRLCKSFRQIIMKFFLKT